MEYMDLVNTWGFSPDGWGGHVLVLEDGSEVHVHPAGLADIPPDHEKSEELLGGYCRFSIWDAGAKAWLGDPQTRTIEWVDAWLTRKGWT